MLILKSIYKTHINTIMNRYKYIDYNIIIISQVDFSNLCR